MGQPEKDVGIYANGGDVFRLLLGMWLVLSRQPEKWYGRGKRIHAMAFSKSRLRANSLLGLASSVFSTRKLSSARSARVAILA